MYKLRFLQNKGMHFFKIYILISFKIFMVTGGDLTETTEIFQDRKWKVLPYGNLPIKMWGFRLITIHNEVFSLGKYQILSSA